MIMSNDSLHINLSALILVYNVSAYVGRCLLSVMKQSYLAIECITVDEIERTPSGKFKAVVSEMI